VTSSASTERVNTPIITASDAEGAGVLFRVSALDFANLPRTPEGKVDFAQDFFGRAAFLTVSGQLNVEAYCLALTKVYTFGPTLRAENSNTSRHLAEFWMIEPEIAFADLSDNAALAEALLKYTFAALLNEGEEDLAFFDQRIEKGLVAKLEGLVGSEFVHMDYGEAIEVLERANEKFEFPVKWGVDLQSEHERDLTEKPREEAGHRDELPEGHHKVIAQTSSSSGLPGELSLLRHSAKLHQATLGSLGSYSHAHRQVENLPGVKQCLVEAIDRRSTMIVSDGQVESVSGA
jgi:aspartyl/asparaginyl-tRNA synthetase